MKQPKFLKEAASKISLEADVVKEKVMKKFQENWHKLSDEEKEVARETSVHLKESTKEFVQKTVNTLNVSKNTFLSFVLDGYVEKNSQG